MAWYTQKLKEKTFTGEFYNWQNISYEKEINTLPDKQELKEFTNWNCPASKPKQSPLQWNENKLNNEEIKTSEKYTGN